MKQNRFFQLGAAALAAALLFGCDTIKREQRMQLKHHGAHAMAGMVLEHPYLQSRIDVSPGYMILQRKEPVFPMMKSDFGRGLVTDTRSGDSVDIRLLELEIDGAWGTGNYTALYIFQSEDDYNQAFTNAWSAVHAGDIFVSADGGPAVIYSAERIAVERD